MRKDMDCGNIIRSVCKEGKSIRDQKNASYVKRQGYENLWLELEKKEQ